MTTYSAESIAEGVQFNWSCFVAGWRKLGALHAYRKARTRVDFVFSDGWFLGQAYDVYLRRDLAEGAKDTMHMHTWSDQ